MVLKHAINRLTAKIKEREWDSGFIWIHGQDNPIPVTKAVIVRFIPEDECIECMVKDVNDPFDPPYPAQQDENGRVYPANLGSSADGWTYIAVDAINRIDLFKSNGKNEEKKIIAAPPGMEIVR